MPILESLMENPAHPTISGATIASGGKLSAQHQWLSSAMAGSRKKNILILGSGYVAGPVVQYLGDRSDFRVTVASNSHAEALAISKLAKNEAIAETLDIADLSRLEKLVEASDVVISLVPATMHLSIAQSCLKFSKHLVTASYISPPMQALHDQYARLPPKYQFNYFLELQRRG